MIFCSIASLQNRGNKKKVEKQVASEIIMANRNNIIHNIPFFHNKQGQGEDAVLLTGEAATMSLSDKITSVLAMSETNTELNDSEHIYILGVDKDQKVVLLKIQLMFKEEQFKMVVAKTIVIDSLDTSASYTVMSTPTKVAVATSDQIIVVNARTFKNTQTVSIAGEPTSELICKCCLIINLTLL